MIDRYGRNIDYLRISVTDRCNLRCKYCMPESIPTVPMSEILTFEEIRTVAEEAAALGFKHIKLTGGEPLVRKGIQDLVRMLKSVPGIEKVTLTTNGVILGVMLPELLSAGLDAVNISLDTLDPDRYRNITGRGDLERTLQAVDLAAASGIRTKVNCVLQKGFNEDEIFGLAKLAFDKGIDVRFIELMPVGIGDPEVGISNTVVLERLMERWPDLEPDASIHGNGPAVYYRRTGINGGIGLISAIHGVFCSSCNRIRLTSQGKIRPCLCYDTETDLRPFLEGTDDELREALREAILSKPESHCFNSEKPAASGCTEHRLMSQIGG